MKAKKKDLATAKKIKKELQDKLGDNLIAVVLYGSRARGITKEDSDMDLFLLMKKRPRYHSREDDIIINITHKYLVEDNLYVSPTVYGVKEYQKWHDYLPLFHWIDKEGIKL